MEQILIRNLPPGTKAALKSRARQNRHSAEAEAREILTSVLASENVTLVVLLVVDEGAEIDFEPVQLGFANRTPEL